MTDEFNGESTFEFVEKKIDDVSISGDPGKAESLSSLSSSVSLLTSPVGASTSSGNLLSNIAPPSALPSFVSRPSDLLVTKEKEAEDADRCEDTVRKQPQANPGIRSKSQSDSTEIPPTEDVENPSQPEQESSGTGASYLFSWVKETVANSNVLSKVAEKAKSSVNSMITTLDPQMHSGGDVNIFVASNKEVKVSPIREAFQSVFGKATVTGVAVESSAVAEQPVGFAAGIKGAEERITATRQLSHVPKDAPIVAIENFLLEVGVDKWYDLGVLILNDPKNSVNLQTFTQMTPVPSQIVTVARDSTPSDYPLKWSGFSITTGSLMGTNLQVSHNEWHHALTGVSRRDIILLAAQSLAGIYKNTIIPV
ncbi:protein PRRC1-like isoform X2 [Venturia canescens]|uniref:protein PRRC1-like isoform X2 n=1 Tax=Venturia canescens TaxID=32260 RepID=UPI001C9D2A27|nr:protein PRRC1-like isoform X2 [Venturia canescens]